MCGSVRYLVLIALLSLGVATAVRDAAVAIGLVLGLLYVFPVVTSVVGRAGDRRVVHPGQYRPAVAAAHPWQGLGVHAAWAAGALLLGGLLLRLRDA